MEDQTVVENVNELLLDDLTPIEIPFAFAGKSYVLKEASEDAVLAWRAKIMSSGSIKHNESGSVQVSDFKVSVLDSEPLLVSLCLYYRIPGKDDKQLAMTEVRALPGRLVKRLFEKIKVISNLDEKPKAANNGETDAKAKDEELAGNVPSSTPVG